MEAKQVIRDIFVKLAENKCQARFLSIEHVVDLQKDMEKLIKGKFFDEEFHQEYVSRFEFNANEKLANAQSIIVIAYPQPQTKVILNWEGRRFTTIIPPTYPEVEYTQEIKALLNPILDLTGYKNGQSTGHDKKHRTNKHEGEIVSYLSCERPTFLDAPDVIK